MSSLDRILPFLRPIEDLLVDSTITEVMVNDGGRRIFVERDGALERVPDRTLEVRNLTVAIKNIARACGDEISDHQPILDARLEDGSRVAAMFPPCSVDGPTLTIRKFTHRYSLEELVSVATLTPTLARDLQVAVGDRIEPLHLDGDLAIGDRLHLERVQAAELGDLFEGQRGVLDQPDGGCFRHQRSEHVQIS